uniref:Uncharacterized protein n=1 Tax=Heterorhabditis bacteriophora TaxID=37862 RepID=A0A1I7WDS8_HETBA
MINRHRRNHILQEDTALLTRIFL